MQCQLLGRCSSHQRCGGSKKRTWRCRSKRPRSGAWPRALNSHGHDPWVGVRSRSPHAPTPRRLGRSLALGGKPIRTNCTIPIQEGLHRGPPQPPDHVHHHKAKQWRLQHREMEASAMHSSAIKAGHDMNDGDGMWWTNEMNPLCALPSN
jgi:hypothetical protein